MIKELPKRLKDLRTLHNYSQRDVANKLNISPSIVSAYETGERTPSTENILALSHLYKCTTDYLLGKSSTAPNVILDTSGLSTEQIQALQALIKTMKHE